MLYFFGNMLNNLLVNELVCCVFLDMAQGRSYIVPVDVVSLLSWSMVMIPCLIKSSISYFEVIVNRDVSVEMSTL